MPGCAENRLKFPAGSVGTIVGFNSLDGSVTVDGEEHAHAFPRLVSGARVRMDANSENNANGATELHVAWNELVME